MVSCKLPSCNIRTYKGLPKTCCFYCEDMEECQKKGLTCLDFDRVSFACDCEYFICDEQPSDVSLKDTGGEVKMNYTFKEFAAKHEISLKEISDKFGIPYRTVQNWNTVSGSNSRECPAYIINMMDIILTAEEKEKRKDA